MSGIKYRIWCDFWSHPVSPSPNNVGLGSMKNEHCAGWQTTAQGVFLCFIFTVFNIGGRGVYFHACVSRLFCPLVGKNRLQGFSHKKSRHAQFSSFWVTSKIAIKFVLITPSLHWGLQLHTILCVFYRLQNFYSHYSCTVENKATVSMHVPVISSVSNNKPLLFSCSYAFCAVNPVQHIPYCCSSAILDLPCKSCLSIPLFHTNIMIVLVKGIMSIHKPSCSLADAELSFGNFSTKNMNTFLISASLE